MGRIITKILNFILKLQEEKIQKQMNSLSFSCSKSKSYMNASESLSINAKTELDKQKLHSRVREIIKKNVKTPEKLLEYIEKSGTKVYRINFADRILDVINEHVGFLPPLKGFRALYLNLLIDKKIKFETKEMFILSKMPVNIYALSHQFHKWYGYKMKLPGFDERSNELFRNIDNMDIQSLSYGDITSLKEALRRDIEAIDFVINLSHENEGAKTALGKIKEGTGANI